MRWHLKKTVESFQFVKKCFYSVYKDNCFFYSVGVYFVTTSSSTGVRYYLCFKHL